MNLIVMLRRASAPAVALALTAVSLAATSAPANAGTSTLGATCTGTQVITYSPPLHREPRTTTTTATITYSCLLPGLPPTVLTGTSGFSVTDTRGCLGAVTTTSGNRTITWADQQQSVLSLTAQAVIVGGQTVVTKTGTVTSGLFEGAAVTEKAVGPVVAELDDCTIGDGVTETTEDLTMAITPAL